MLAYTLRRLGLVIPTLLGIMTLNFVIIQLAPGGPLEQMAARAQNLSGGVLSRITGEQAEVPDSSTGSTTGGAESFYRGRTGLDEAYLERLRQQYGFDRPLWVRYGTLLWDYARFDLGESFFRDISVLDLVIEKLPVSLSLGLWSTLLIYLVSIPLGVAKASRHGSGFDFWTTLVVVIGNAIPAFMFALLLLIFFAGGQYWQIFPLRGLTSENFETLSFFGKLVDYFWHLCLPLFAILVGGFAGLTMLTRNSFLDQIQAQYVLTARAKGARPRRVLYGHVFRNAMLIVIAGFPATLIGILFTSSILIEILFSLDGLGLLAFEAAFTRDYPVIFGALYIGTLLGLLLGILSDLMYHWIDPRLDFSASLQKY